jgi:hypothetical protein
MLPEQPEIPFMQGDAVVPDTGSHVNLPVQLPVPLGTVCLEYEGSHWDMIINYMVIMATYL